MQPTVGAPTVGGLFSSIKRAVKSVGKTAKRAVRKAARRVRRTAKSAVRRMKRGALRSLRHTYRGAKALSRGDVQGAMAHGMASQIQRMNVFDPTGVSHRLAQNPGVRAAALRAASLYPATAPFAPALAAANSAYTNYQMGQQAARRIQAGERKPELLSAVNRGLRAREGVAQMARLAQSRDPRAMQVMGAFRQLGGGGGFW